MKINYLVMAVALGLGVSTMVAAQETSSSIRGVVTTESGQVLPNAVIMLTDKRTGASRTFNSNNTGTYTVRGLQVGGPYTLTVTGQNGQSEIVDNVFLTLGETQNINITVKTAAAVERIAVSGQAITNQAYGSKSPVANFDLAEIQTIPNINRDLGDLVSADPRVYVDVGFSRGIQCNGASPRFNSLTVDGVRMNDNFGLNDNGYPTERMPFSFDAIQQVAVEFAPFDVKYGGFTACNINAVTKSGTNEIKGSVFYDYTNESLQGDKLEGTNLTIQPFSEKRYGFNVGGALIKDKLFFFGAYEKYEGASNFLRGPANSNAGTPVNGLTQAQLDRIAQIARDVYGYQVGEPITSTPVEDEKYLIKLDWYINDKHRAALTYNYNDGGSVRESDSGSTQYEFSDHYYSRNAEFESYVGQVFSDWTDNFSTEVRLGYSELINKQINIGPGGLGEVWVNTNNGTSTATVYLGVDDSRQANDLNYDTTFMKIAGTYNYGDHIITAGYEREKYNVFNMFVQHSIGEYRFNSIDAFEAGTPATIYYGNAAGTHNPREAGAEFGYAINTVYAQDEFYIADHDLTLTMGLRYDWYTSNDKPRENANFVNRYGFTNTTTFDGEGLLQPRIGANWNVNEYLELRGGIGLYSGGNPNVWIANGFQNDGITQIQITDRSGINVLTAPLSGAGRPLYDIPQSIYDMVTNATGDSAVNALDPNFKMPKDWKYAIGGTYSFDSGYIVMADLMYTSSKNQAIITDYAMVKTGTAVDGRPIYGSKEGSRREDFLLTNASSDAKQLSFSTSVSKRHDFGLDWSLAYAHIQSEDSNPMTSSVAYSNWNNFARSDFNDPQPATSNYETPHRFTGRLTYGHEFFDGYKTTVSLIASHNKGRPYSYTFSNANFAGDSTTGRQLVYVPTGPNDPNVNFASTFDQNAFFDYVNSSGLDKYAGGIAERNAFESDWWTKVDLRLEQELPGFMEGHKAKAFFVINNLTNLLNDDWGVMYEARFPQTANIVDGTLNADGTYTFNRFITPQPQARVANASLWKMTVGIKYDF